MGYIKNRNLAVAVEVSVSFERLGDIVGIYEGNCLGIVRVNACSVAYGVRVLKLRVDSC